MWEWQDLVRTGWTLSRGGDRAGVSTRERGTYLWGSAPPFEGSGGQKGARAGGAPRAGRAASQGADGQPQWALASLPEAGSGSQFPPGRGTSRLGGP